MMDPDFNPPEMGTGLIERDYGINPVGYCSQPFRLPLIPRDEWVPRLEARIAAEAQLSDLRKHKKIDALNQANTNYCWFYSSTMATMLTRVQQGAQNVPLSGASGAAIIKNFRNVGGWGSQSLEFIAERGVCRLQDWPQGEDGLKRHHNSPSVWETAKKFRITEWMDLEPRNIDQYVTCLLLGIPVVSDYNWWGHSVCSMDLVEIDPRNPERSIKSKIINSWSNNWGENGEGILEAGKAVPDGMIAPFVTVGG